MALPDTDTLVDPTQVNIQLPALPKGAGIQRLTDLPEDTWSILLSGFEGAGKTYWYLNQLPLPMLIANIDRPLTRGHLGALKRERAEQIFFKNLRERMDDIGPLEAGLIKDQLEDLVNQNLDYLRGGTFVLDGGSLWRDVLKMSDPTISAKRAAGTRFNPKDKEAINAYLAGFMSFVQDQGINLVITSHAAWSWEMQTDPESGKKQLVRTKQMYPKIDDMVKERGNVHLMQFLQCRCGRPITSEDGTCSQVHDPTNMDPAGTHIGRKFMTRFVKNKFNPGVEGRIQENLDWATLKLLSNPKTASLV